MLQNKIIKILLISAFGFFISIYNLKAAGSIQTIQPDLVIDKILTYLTIIVGLFTGTATGIYLVNQIIKIRKELKKK